MQIKNLLPGMKVYECRKNTMGNTTIKSYGTYVITIKEVDVENEIVVASWNGNPPRTFNKRSWSKWTKDEPVLIQGPMGNFRKPTKEEKKALREKNGE